MDDDEHPVVSAEAREMSTDEGGLVRGSPGQYNPRLSQASCPCREELQPDVDQQT